MTSGILALHLGITAALMAATVCAQDFEIGANVAYGFYRNGTVFGAAESAKAGIRNRFGAGVLLGEDKWEYISGEIRYLYHDGHPFLEAPGVKSDIQGQSHTITYELLFHFRDRESRFRPFVAGGAGVKGYVIAGPPPNPQPVPGIASLVDRDEWKIVYSVGGGVKYRLGERVVVRVEFRDYMTTFPKEQIVPAPHNTARGIFQQFTPVFGIGYLF